MNEQHNCGTIRTQKDVCRYATHYSNQRLKKTAAISLMCNESNEPVFITKNGYGDMVIMSMKTCEERMLIQDVSAKLIEAENEILEGKTEDALTALKELRAKHGL